MKKKIKLISSGIYGLMGILLTILTAFASLTSLTYLDRKNKIAVQLG